MSPEDQAKFSALRRTKSIATGALVMCIAIFLGARAWQDTHPLLGYVAAFAEAAAIGGLADWYAVVALFRRPLGLPIPHTAIIPVNKDRIADNLGRFIEQNFLAPELVRKKLEEVDFAQMVADWLSDSSRSAGLSHFVGKLAPRAFSALEGSGLRDFVSKRIMEQLGKVEIAPFVADMLEAMTNDRRHQQVFDRVLHILGQILVDEGALAALRDKIRQELPSLVKFFRADAYLLKKIVASAGTLIGEVEADLDHPLRQEFDDFMKKIIKDLRTSSDYAQRVEQLKRDLLARSELGDMAGDLWAGFRTFIEQDLACDESMVRRHLTDMFVEGGRQLSADENIRSDMNQGFIVALEAFVEKQKSGVSTFIADQVKSWDMLQMTRLIELNIGRDLQYIRFNGMLIGGVAGLVLHITEKLIFYN